MAFFVAAIIMLAATYALYYSFGNGVKNVEKAYTQELVEKVHKTGENIDELDEQELDYRFRFICGYESELSRVDATVWIEDAQSGEIVAESERGLFLYTRENEEDTLRLYYCDPDRLGDKWSQFDDEVEKPEYILGYFEDMEYVIGNNAVVYFVRQPESYLVYEVHDVYVKNHEFVPGVVDIFTEKYTGDTYEGEREYIATIDMAPQDKGEYEHIDETEYAALASHMFIVVGLDSDKNKADLRAQVSSESFDGECNYYFTQDSELFPGRITMLCRMDSTDILGRKLTVYRYTERNFSRDCRGILQIMALILGTVAFIIGLLIARKKYLENKYFCDMNDYRKSLMDSMAHDLRSPLTVMGGYAQNLVEDVNGDKRQYYADSIIKNVEYMDKIITDNLSLSRLSSEELAKDRQQVNFVEKLEGLFEIYKTALEERKVELVIEGEYIRKVNEVSIKSALENVVSNAVKYVNIGGQIHVYTKGKKLIIYNTTDAIPEGKINNLWNPFVKGDKSRGNEKGTGLGLAIAKKVFDINRIKATLEFDEEAKAFTVILN